MTEPDRPVVCLACPGGIEHSGGIGRELGYLLTAWRASSPPHQPVVLDTRGPHSIVFSPLFLLWSILRLAGLVLAGRKVLLHVNLASRGSTLRKLILCGIAGLLPVAILIHLHGAQFDLFFRGLPAPAQWLVRRMFRRAERVVVLGESWRRLMVEEIGVPAERVAVVYNGVPGPSPRRALGPAGEAAPQPCRILFLGRLGDRKGVPELMQALAGLTGQEWTATLAGDGEVERFRAEAARLGLAGRIAFPGWVGRDTAEALLAEADILVLPSYNEGLPVAVVEALANGVAVVTTPVGALPDLLEDGQSALLVPPGDSAALAAALGRLLADPALRRAIAQGGHAVFVRHLDITLVADIFTRLYQEIAATPRAPAS